MRWPARTRVLPARCRVSGSRRSTSMALITLGHNVSPTFLPASPPACHGRARMARYPCQSRSLPGCWPAGHCRAPQRRPPSRSAPPRTPPRTPLCPSRRRCTSPRPRPCRRLPPPPLRGARRRRSRCARPGPAPRLAAILRPLPPCLEQRPPLCSHPHAAGAPAGNCSLRPARSRRRPPRRACQRPAPARAAPRCPQLHPCSAQQGAAARAPTASRRPALRRPRARFPRRPHYGTALAWRPPPPGRARPGAAARVAAPRARPPRRRRAARLAARPAGRRRARSPRGAGCPVRRPKSARAAAGRRAWCAQRGRAVSQPYMQRCDVITTYPKPDSSFPACMPGAMPGPARCCTGFRPRTRTGLPQTLAAAWCRAAAARLPPAASLPSASDSDSEEDDEDMAPSGRPFSSARGPARPAPRVETCHSTGPAQGAIQQHSIEIC